MKQVLRTEKKYLLNPVEYYRTTGRLRKTLREDIHNVGGGYLVRSLYFDTASDSDYFDKQAGVEVRKKLRIRTYEPASDTAFLEIKQKQGSLQLKRSLQISRREAQLLIDGKPDFLLEREDAFADECYALIQTRGYRPKTIVEYRRAAFVAKECQTRITLDSEIRATESSFDLFSEKLSMNPVLDADKTVLEVKYDTVLLSYIKDILRIVDKSELSVSKYVLALQNSYLTALN